MNPAEQLILLGGTSSASGSAGASLPPLDTFSGPAADMAVGTFAWITAAIGQNALTTDDGSPSNATMGASGFVSGTFTGQRVSKLFAQVGAGTFEQATLATRPTIWQSTRESWPEIRWHSRLGTSGNKMLAAVSPPTARSGQNWTYVSIERADQESVSGGIGLDVVQKNCLNWSMTGSGSAYGAIGAADPSTGAWSNQNRIWTGGGSFADSNAPHRPTLKYAVHVTRFNAAGVTKWVDGVKTTIGGTATTSNVAPYKLNQLNDFGLYSDNVSSLGHAFFPALSDAQVTELTGLIHARLYGATPTSLWYFDGDSITGGYSAADGSRDIRQKSWPYELISGLPAATRAKVTGVNVAWSGANLETAASSEHKLMTNRAGKVNAHIGSGTGYTNRVVVICAGANDISLGSTGAATLAKLVTYQADAITAGATRVLVCTQIPRQGFSGAQNTELSALNSGIISTFGADAIDVAAQNWQPGGAGDWTTNYQDGIHPNAAGRALFIAAISSTISALA